jgi:tetratricopeptide (TPR) repeat protein
MSNDGNAHGRKPPFAFLSRYVQLAVIAVLLIMLLPQLAEKSPAPRKALDIDPPVALVIYRSGHAQLDSLGNEGLESFNRKEWNRAVRLLGEAHLHYSVMIKEQMGFGYPDDLRFYLGLSYAYRGRLEKGIPLLEEEAADNPIEAKYPWYLAHLYLAAQDTEKARTYFERIVRLGGLYAEEADEALQRIAGQNR